nr:hypothetical protein [Candidatus Neomarinimicrobiota bacterium]
MRKLLVLLSIFMIFISCGKNKTENFTNFGSTINETKFITPQELIDQKDNLKWREVAVKGKIISICEHSISLIGLKVNDTTEVNVFSIDNDKPFVFPKEKCIGKRAKVVGIFQIKDGFPNSSNNEESIEHDEYNKDLEKVDEHEE